MAAREADPDATLLLNDFGYETDDEYRSASGTRSATLDCLDELLGTRGLFEHEPEEGWTNHIGPGHIVEADGPHTTDVSDDAAVEEGDSAGV